MGTAITGSETGQQQGLAGALLQWWAARKWKKDHVQQMRLIETLPLGGKRQLMLVQCANESFLVGGGPDQITTIVRLGDATDSVVRDGRCE